MEEIAPAFSEFRGRGYVTFPRKIGQVLKKGAVTSTASLFFMVIFIGAFIANHWINVSSFSGRSFQGAFFPSTTPVIVQKKIIYSLNCSSKNVAQTCSEYPTTYKIKDSSTDTCPEYFRWIHEDLRPWESRGITRDMVENAKSGADIRIVIVNGNVYVEKYNRVYQTRDVFTIWGILQLLRLYPGKLPDLDFMFGCQDKPSIKKSDYTGVNATKVPPLFHYCGDDLTFDLVFPDWSFWGWHEINIEPWDSLKKDLEKGNHQMNWTEREPYAYWKGNVRISPDRLDLWKCNFTAKHDWNARIFNVNWREESKNGYKNSKLANQCKYRYKIYVEGKAWSVSEKYILGCDSMSLLIEPWYYDFFTRDLLPMIHYWPIKKKNKCRSIKYAVDWGNKHTEKAQKIGKEASRYIQEQLKMKYVYDYMFHLLNEYAKLLKYKPTVPPGAVKMCLETMACNAKGLDKEYKIKSMVKSPADTSPCTMPPPYSSLELQAFLERKIFWTKKIEMWEESGKI